MEAIKIEGRVYKLGQTEEKGEKNFKVREMILEVDYGAEYPQFITIQGTKDNCGKMDDLPAGTIVNVHVNLQGRLYTGKDGIEKSFNALSLWKFDVLNSVSSMPIPSSDPVDDDLPF